MIKMHMSSSMTGKSPLQCKTQQNINRHVLLSVNQHTHGELLGLFTSSSSPVET